MRELTGQKGNGNMLESLTATVMDEPAAGGACCRYDITGFDTDKNPSSYLTTGYQSSFSRLILLFQNGPVAEQGDINGISHEVLLAVLIDRLTGFQSGPFSCRENAIALSNLISAQSALALRSGARKARGVEGTHGV